MQHTGKLDSIDYMITAVSCCKTLCPSIYAGLTSTTWNILADQTYPQCLPPSVSPRLKLFAWVSRSQFGRATHNHQDPSVQSQDSGTTHQASLRNLHNN